MRPPLRPLDRAQRIPASYTQEERVRAGGTVHVQNNVVALALRLRGSMTADTVNEALARLVARHDALRLTFSVDSQGVRAHVADEPSFGYAVQSVEGLAPTRRLAAGLARLARDASEPFDIRTGPLVRGSVVQVSDAVCLLGLTVDHMLADGRSCEIILRDLVALLDEVRSGIAADLPTLSVQFPDWTVWERRYLQGPARQRLAEYWRTTLAGTTALPASGLEEPAAERGPAGVDAVWRAVDGDVWTRLSAVARDLRTLPFNLVSAVLKATVYRRRRLRELDEAAADVAVFGALANRGSHVLDDVVGYFATSAVLRTNLSGDPSLEELVRRESRMLLGAMAHEELPHPLVAMEVSPELYGIRYRPGARIPAYLNFDMPHARPPTRFTTQGLCAEVMRVPVVELPRSGLRLIAHPLNEGIRIEARCRTDYFSRMWVDSFLTAYHTLLSAWVKVPGARLSQVAPE
ncbi:condensation domain-containing protein [Streptomyces europaeiscabiei]|uniref:condensation domain-containing protein n=1 Tax=Streptomyces europaeiscabiei TaxID=146819 RepID=UPI0029B4D4E1|nr:condensation domain-containing protein [Streptomyces europaeiscabiei]MDX3611300.1 condensation domain-containing protein [Streptomyces europaeiscabiei]